MDIIFYLTTAKPPTKTLSDQYATVVTIGSTAYNANKFLAFNFFKGLKPVFERLKSDYLLTDCQGGLNQIQNESLKGFLWC